MAPTAPDAIICGDPARALFIAESLLVAPRMSNHHRGLWGYLGTDLEGRELTVQATGIGGPSAAVVIEELAGLGVRRLIRVGSARGVGSALPLGAGIAVEAAVSEDGASRALGVAPGAGVEPDRSLFDGLRSGLPYRARIVSQDLHATSHGGGRPDPLPGALASDLQTAAVLAACRRYEIAAAAALLIVEVEGVRLEDDPLEAGMRGLARVAQRALAG